MSGKGTKPKAWRLSHPDWDGCVDQGRGLEGEGDQGMVLGPEVTIDGGERG